MPNIKKKVPQWAYTRNQFLEKKMRVSLITLFKNDDNIRSLSHASNDFKDLIGILDNFCYLNTMVLYIHVGCLIVS